MSHYYIYKITQGPGQVFKTLDKVDRYQIEGAILDLDPADLLPLLADGATYIAYGNGQAPIVWLAEGDSEWSDTVLELMNEVDRTVGHMKTDSVHCPDPNDRATQEADMGMELRTRDRERKLLGKIDQTLRKLDDHDRGLIHQRYTERRTVRDIARERNDLSTFPPILSRRGPCRFKEKQR